MREWDVNYNETIGKEESLEKFNMCALRAYFNGCFIATLKNKTKQPKNSIK